MIKIINLVVVMLLLLPIANAEEIILVLSPFEGNINPEFNMPYKAWFESPNTIIIYNYLSYDEDLYRQVVMHELQHYYCYKLFGDADTNHKRCF